MFYGYFFLLLYITGVVMNQLDIGSLLFKIYSLFENINLLITIYYFLTAILQVVIDSCYLLYEGESVTNLTQLMPIDLQDITSLYVPLMFSIIPLAAKPVPNLNPNWISVIFDGDGTFGFSIVKHPYGSLGWRVIISCGLVAAQN